MRKKLLCLVLLSAAVVALMIPTLGIGQQGMPGGKGGKGGGGGKGQKGMGGDPNKFFDFMAKGKDYVTIADSKMMAGPLQEWATENGITNGQLTREQFTQAMQALQQKMASGQIPGGGQGNMDPDQMAAMSFKRMDRNGDGFLTEDEMSDKLKPVWKQYDKNNDGMIDLEEYKAYFKVVSAQWGNNNGGDQSGVGGVAVLLEDELDKKPTVYRAGKLPKELMAGGMAAWFSQLDTDNDGQVGYYEWRKSGKSYDEFALLDRNGDGLLTPEEVMWYLKENAPKTLGNPSVTDTVAMGPGNNPQIGRPQGPNNRFPGPGGPGGPSGKGGPGGPTKGNKGGPGGGTKGPQGGAKGGGYGGYGGNKG